jgi:hypothetical protein
MGKFALLALIGFFFISCAEKINLENQEYGKKNSIFENSKSIEKSTCYFFDVPSIIISDIDKFSFGDINLSNFIIEDGYAYSRNEISFLVNNYNEKKNEGFAIRLVNNDGNKILDYLNNKYSKTDNWDSRGNGVAHFWENKESWLFFFQSDEKDKNDIVYKQSVFIMSKKNAKIQSPDNKNAITLLDYFKYIYPQEK